jgi:hypothetical protein
LRALRLARDAATNNKKKMRSASQKGAA